MKAQAYELSALPARKKAPSVYQFNLMTVVDTDLVRLMFKGPGEIEGTPLDTEHYLARYIVRKRETFSRIRFITAGAFASTLQDYERLHQANCKWFGTECDAFYADLVKDEKRIAAFAEEFKSKVHWLLIYYLERQFNRSIDFGVLSVNWNEFMNTVWIGVSVTPEVMVFLNNDSKIKALFAKALQEVYRYSGEFHFDDDIPF